MTCARTDRGILSAVLGGAIAAMLSAAAFAEPATLTLSDATTIKAFDSAALASRQDASEVSVDDPVYKRAMIWRAVPIAALLEGIEVEMDGVVESVALDGYVAQLPAADVMNRDPSKPIAFLAFEESGHPWPSLPNKEKSAAPFYIVWRGGDPVSSKRWAYQVAKLQVQKAPAKRWPQIDVGGDVPPMAPARLGQELFVQNCLVCHMMNGGGAAKVGPDLGLPRNATDYLQPAALKALIVDPASVRTWPEQKMPGFASKLSGGQIDAIVAYLERMKAHQ